MDDARVIAAQKLVDKLTREYQRLTARNEARTAAFTTAKQTETAVETWLRDLRGTAVLDDFSGPEPTLSKGESIADGISRLQRRGRELKAVLHTIRSAPFPSAHAKAKMRAEIETLAMLGAPNVANLIEHDRKIEWPTTNLQSRILNVDTPAAGFAEVPDALAIIVWLHGPALIKRLNAEIDAEADDSAALTHSDREKRSAEAICLRSSVTKAGWSGQRWLKVYRFFTAETAHQRRSCSASS